MFVVWFAASFIDWWLVAELAAGLGGRVAWFGRSWLHRGFGWLVVFALVLRWVLGLFTRSWLHLFYLPLVLWCLFAVGCLVWGCFGFGRWVFVLQGWLFDYYLCLC